MRGYPKSDNRLDKPLGFVVPCENLSQGGGDMVERYPWIGAEHPPRRLSYTVETSPFPRRFLKATLVVVIFVLSFHLPDLNPRISHRRETVEEIFSLLEKQRTGLAAITKEELAEVT